jgi:hypothetical protein
MNKALENFQKHTTEFLDALALIPDRARNSAPEGEWSAAYIVHHIADGEIHFAGRYLLALGSDNPTMFFFDEERYPEMLGYEKRSINKSLAAIVGIRATILETLSLIDEQHWARTMVREDGVTVTLEDLVLQADGHITGHIEQLKALTAQI